MNLNRRRTRLDHAIERFEKNWQGTLCAVIVTICLGAAVFKLLLAYLTE